MPFDFAQPLLDEDGLVDDDVLEDYKEALCEEFINAPEGQDFEGGWVELLVDYGVAFPGVTPASMTPAALEEVVFDVIPRKVSCEPDVAPEILDELRAYLRFAERAFGFARTRQCLAVLDERGAQARLRRNLADPGRWGMAKSFVAHGTRLGFDLSTEAGLQTWVKAHNAGLDLSQGGLPAIEQVVTAPGFHEHFKRERAKLDADREALRRRRKTQKKARKRSR